MRFAPLTFSCLVLAACASAQTPKPPAAPTFNGDRAFEDLKKIVAIGPRPAGSEGARKTRDYIKQQLAAAGATVSEQPFDQQTPAGMTKMVNVSGIFPGAGQGRLVIAGHYDTKLFKEFAFVGANDGGSSTAFLIELARALAGRANPVTIELLFLDGEEAVGEWNTGHTFGSQHYVDAAVEAGSAKQIKAMVLVDMIGDKDLVIMRESYSTPWLKDAIWSAAKRLNRPEFVADSAPIEDDHRPFLEAGIPAVDLIDLVYPDESMRFWHTAEDTLDKTSAKSLQAVGDVLLAALPAIELRIK